jgi:phage terminase large subunit
LKTSVLYSENINATEDVIVNQGGSSSGKTYSILQVLFTFAATQQNKVITVVGQDIPNLKAGALRDAINIAESTPAFNNWLTSYNKSDRVFTFKTGSIIEFKSFDDAQDARSGKRDYLFINEANGIPYNVYEQLNMRTRIRTFIDYNPDAEFWVHEKVIGYKGSKLLISDHRHNPFVEDKIREKIEGLKEKDIELWKVYARGLTGKIEGLIFRNYNTIHEIPKVAELVGYGMDFGFTNSYTTCIAVYRHNDNIYLNELLYERGLINSDIINRLRELKISEYSKIIGDSAEPKTIEEIYRSGFNIHPAKKGADSIKSGIDVLKRYNINITSNSTNLLKEFRTYKWATDKQGKSLNEPVKYLDHGIDGVRYLALSELSINNNGKYALY